MLNAIIQFACAVMLVAAVVMEVRLAAARHAARGGRGHEEEAQMRHLGGFRGSRPASPELEEAALARVDAVLDAGATLRSHYDHCGMKCWRVESPAGTFSYITCREWADPDYIVSDPAVARLYTVGVGGVDDAFVWNRAIYIKGGCFARLKELYDAAPAEARMAYAVDKAAYDAVERVKDELTVKAVRENVSFGEIRKSIAAAEEASATTAAPPSEPKTTETRVTTEATMEPEAEPKVTTEPKVEPKAEPEVTTEPKAEPEVTTEPKAEPETKVTELEPKGTPKEVQTVVTTTPKPAAPRSKSGRARSKSAKRGGSAPKNG